MRMSDFGLGCGTCSSKNSRGGSNWLIALWMSLANHRLDRRPHAVSRFSDEAAVAVVSITRIVFHFPCRNRNQKIKLSSPI